MALIPSWLAAPQTWDTVVLNNRVIPGVADVTYTISSGLTVRKPPKGHYAAIVDQGYKPAQGEIRIRFGFEGVNGYGSAEDQWESWQALVEEIFPRRRATRQAYPVSHPKFALAGIASVYVADVSSPEGEGPGTRTATIKWIEYGKVVSAAAGSVNGAPAKPVGSTDLSSLDRSPAADPSVAEADP